MGQKGKKKDDVSESLAAEEDAKLTA
jgi:hypothetical protein